MELLEFANTVHAMDTIAEAVDYVAAFTRGALQCPHVCILSNSDGLRGDPAARAASDDPLCPDWSFPGGVEARRLLESPRAAVAPSIAAVPGALMDTTSERAVAFGGPVAFVPLTGSRSCLGVLCAGGRSAADAFTVAELEVLSSIGSTTSVALHNQLARDMLNDVYAETKAYAIELARANTRLQMLDRLKGDCLAFVLHELRTPLNFRHTIQMLERCQDPEERMRLIRTMCEGYDRLELFISKGMDYLNWFSDAASVAPASRGGAERDHRAA